ncbi:putative short-chain dehydrogenase [Paraphaeosphaeria sporulosa]|uniref:Putative short-chain dehydrogenase n=1 Tax=Paraphaeosphaeria sporulosa TaxID=1460663 RepID=A0A177CDH9_9PLEO|nr:putative short-chain dehydrogenase [Paraphaeosphaeria sporulosa]OAG05693.1 putative short-chain dehydrogenase [Paraphaeosphaeria sporulosa]
MSDPFNPYAAEHAAPAGPGDARPTAFQIVKDEGRVGKLSDKVIFITGASSGLGIETARALHETGAKLYLGVRDLEKGKKVVDDILSKSTINGDIELLQIGLDSLESVRKAAEEFKTRSGKLNILINNAGIMALPHRTLTQDGHEAQFATNHLAHFLLFQLLKPLLLSSASPAFSSRVVALSSLSHRVGTINFDDLTLKDNYHPFLAYGQSKLANLWMANHITRLYAPQNLFANAVHPGVIFTPLVKHMDAAELEEVRQDEEKMKGIKSVEQGAATTVWAAVGKCWEGKGGKYLENVRVSPPAPEDADFIVEGYSKLAYDEAGEKKLWETSNALVGFED